LDNNNISNDIDKPNKILRKEEWEKSRITFFLFLFLLIFTSFRCILLEQMDAVCCQRAHRSVVMRFMTEADKVNEYEYGVREGGWWWMSFGQNDVNVSQVRSQVLGSVKKNWEI